MKKLLLLLTLPILFLFAGCGDNNDDNDNLKDHPIVGTWILSDYGAAIHTSSSSLDSYLERFLLEEYVRDNSFLLGSTVTFGENGKATFRSYDGESYSGTFSVKESVLTLKVNKERGYWEFEIRNNQLYLTVDQTTPCQIEAIHMGYTGTIYKAEFTETFTRLHE